MNILPILQHAQLCVEFFVPGKPATAGSKRGHWNPAAVRKDGGLGKVVMAPDAKDAVPWRMNVQGHAMQAMIGKVVATGPILLMAQFVMQRPKSHYRGGKYENGLRGDAPAFSGSKPDIDKMARAINDAIKGIVWHDDSQVALQITSKPYANPGETPGAQVRVYGIVIPK
jgi:Holliday junction resolvase RusA-like endonuclease